MNGKGLEGGVVVIERDQLLGEGVSTWDLGGLTDFKYLLRWNKYNEKIWVLIKQNVDSSVLKIVKVKQNKWRVYLYNENGNKINERINRMK